MLESFLIRPDVLTEDDVMDILKQAFSKTGMKEVVAESVKGRVSSKKRIIALSVPVPVNHHRGSYISLTLAAASYPFVDLPSWMEYNENNDKSEIYRGKLIGN